jgi:hypothetical protein
MNWISVRPYIQFPTEPSSWMKENKISFVPFDSDTKQKIIKAIESAYNKSGNGKSGKVKNMLEGWINNSGKPIKLPINIYFLKNTFETNQGGYNDPNVATVDKTGKIYIDVNFLNGIGYIDDYGRPKQLTLEQAIIHEFGHALGGNADNLNLTDLKYPVDYQGSNVRFVNPLWKELGFSQLRSYTGQGLIALRQDLPNYSYTNDNLIDSVFKVDNIDPITKVAKGSPLLDWDTSKRGDSRDLLLGGSGDNKLSSGLGNDFLFGE